MPFHKNITSTAVMDAIRKGEQYRKKYACEGSWETWRAYYRGNWEDGILPVNLFFMLVRTIVPRIYFRSPGISVTPARPGVENAILAQLLERVDNKLVSRMKIKNQMKKLVQDAFMFGTGILKVGFGSEYSATPYLEEEGFVSPLIGKSEESLEYNKHVRNNMPWALRTHPGTFIVPDGCESFDDAPWCAHKIVRPIMDVRRDPRLKYRDKVKPGEPIGTSVGIDKLQYKETVSLYEVKDRKFRRVMITADGVDKFLLNEPDYFQEIYGYNFFPIVFNPDDSVFWGVPDSQILEPRQREINEVKTQAMKHRRLSIVKWLAKKGSITPEEAAKMLSEEVNSMVMVDGEPSTDFQQIQASTIPTELFRAGEEVMMDSREEMGFSRNQFGEYHPKTNTTATESRIVQQAVDLRVDERRDMLADLLEDVFSLVNKIIFDLWTEDIVMDVLGPGGVPIWVEFQPKMLSEGAYALNIDPDTTTPVTREAREAKALEVYQIFKQNPLIDPEELTRYLLREMHGVEYDRLMRGMPQGAGLTQQKPLNIGQYTNVLNKAGPLGLPMPMPGAGGPGLGA